MSVSNESEIRREELSDLNTRAWNGEENVFKLKGKLDSSLKKNTAFIKKIRSGITKETEKQFIDAIQTTSLEKYINEISAALCESLTKVKNADVQSTVEVVSALHQRFTTSFTPFVELYFVHSFVHPKDRLVKKEEKELMVRLRNLLKLAMEFYLHGIFRNMNDMPEDELPPYLKKLKIAGKDDIPIIIPIMKEIMSYEFNSGITLPIMTSFLKRFSFMLYESDSKLNPKYEESISVFLRKLFKSYVTNAVKTAEKDYKSIHKIKSTANIIAIKIGKVVTNMENEAEEIEEILKEFNTFCEFACPIVGIDLPKYEINKSAEESSKVTLVTKSATDSNVNQIWENEDVKKFYEDIPTIESLVSQEAIENMNSKVLASDGKGNKIADIMLRLGEAETAKDIDDIVVDFWEWGLSNKASRNRLSKYIIELREVSKFKNIARFLKINAVYFDKCIEDLITRLDKSFRFQIRHDSVAEKDIIIFSELIKFKMIPIHVIFHKIRLLVLNIEVNNNIDLLSLMFEGCSKCLLYDEQYKDHTKEMIDLLKQLYKTKKFSHTDKYAVKLFLLSLNPPKVKSQNTVELLREEQFLNYMVKTQLNLKTFPLISNIIKCADWNNEIIYKRIEILFSNPSEMNYIDIKFLAAVLRNVTLNCNKSLKTVVVDQLIEDITTALEYNDYQSLRKRLSEVIYFIELINLKVIPRTYLIPMLYKIVCYGHENKYPSRDTYCEADGFDDFFRIKMVSEILSRVYAQHVLHQLSPFIKFMRFFNYYIFTKEHPLSIDVSNKLADMFRHLNEFELPNGVEFSRAESYEDAIIQLQSEFKENDGNAVNAKTSQEGSNDGKQESNIATEDADNDDDEDDDDDDEISELTGDLDDDDVNKIIGLKVGSDSDSDDSDSDSDSDSDDDDSDDDSSEENDKEQDSIIGNGEGEEVVEGKHVIVSDDDVDFDDDDDDDEIQSEKERNEAFREAELDMEYRKIMKESLQNNTTMQLKKGTLSEKLGTPESILYNLGKGGEEEGGGLSTFTAADNDDNNGSNKQNKSMKFTFLARSGKKIQAKSLSIPENTKIAVNLAHEQEKIRAEKDRIKNFVLRSVRNSDS